MRTKTLPILLNVQNHLANEQFAGVNEIILYYSARRLVNGGIRESRFDRLKTHG